MKSAITTNLRRIDVTGSLADPSFWALQVSTSPESASGVWDFTKREAEELFVRFFRRHWDDGAWPFVRLPLDDSRYLEIEYAEVEEMEEQDRVCPWCLAILAQALMAQPSAGIAIRAGRDANQPIDEEYRKKIREYASEPFFKSPLTDYLPTSKAVPTPKALLSDIAARS